MAGLKGSRFQDLAASVSPLPGLVARVFTRVNVLTRKTGREGVAAIWDLKYKRLRKLLLIYFSLCIFLLCVTFTLQLLPKSASDRLICPPGMRRSSWW